MTSSAINLEGSGFSSLHELDAWLAFCEWENDTDSDPSFYEHAVGRGWFPVVRARASNLVPFIGALADLLVADLLRVSPGTG